MTTLFLRFFTSQTADEMSFDLNPAIDLNLSLTIPARGDWGWRQDAKMGNERNARFGCSRIIDVLEKVSNSRDAAKA